MCTSDCEPRWEVLFEWKLCREMTQARNSSWVHYSNRLLPASFYNSHWQWVAKQKTAWWCTWDIMFPRLYPIKAKLENKQYVTVDSHRLGRPPNHCYVSATQTGCWTGASSCPSLLLVLHNPPTPGNSLRSLSWVHSHVTHKVSLDRPVAFIMKGQLEE